MSRGPYCERCGLLVGFDCGCPVVAPEVERTADHLVRLAVQLEAVVEDANVLICRLRLMDILTR